MDTFIQSNHHFFKIYINYLASKGKLIYKFFNKYITEYTI